MPPSGSNLKQAKLDVLVRPYPRAVAGTPISYAFHAGADDRLFELVYEVDLSVRAPTEVFIPARHYPDGYVATVTGPARIVSKDGAALLKLRARGGGEIRVEVRRRQP